MSLWKSTALRKIEPDTRVAVRKSMYEVGRLASLLQDLNSLRQCCEGPYVDAPDNAMADKLKSHVEGLADTLKEMVGEETTKLLEGYGGLETAAVNPRPY